MDVTTMWALGIIVAVFGSCFGIILNRIDKNREKSDGIGKSLDLLKITFDNFSATLTSIANELAVLHKALETKTDYKYVNDEFYRKEMAKLQFDNIQQSFIEIKEDFKMIRTSLEKIIEKHIDN